MTEEAAKEPAKAPVSARPTYDQEYIRTVIGRLSFRFAKTMPHIPHEYAVRGPENEADYAILAQAILDHGEMAYWGTGKTRRRHRYLYPGDGRKYWLMTTQIRQSHILNRALLADYDENNQPIVRAAPPAELPG